LVVTAILKGPIPTEFLGKLVV